MLHKKALKGVADVLKNPRSSPRAATHALLSVSATWSAQSDTFALASSTLTLLEETLNWNDLPVAAGSGV